MNAPQIPALPKASFASKKTAPEQVGPPKSFLGYGGTGTRKTSMIGELVAEGFYNKALALDIDNGSEVLTNNEAVQAALLDGRIELYPIDPFAPTSRMEIENTILEAAGMWRNPQGHILPNPNIPDFGYDLLVIDTVNLMGEIAIKDFLATTFSEKTGKPDGLAAWGKFAVWMDEMVRLVHNSNRFAGAFLMHSKEDEEKTGAVKIKPKMQGSFKDSIASIPSIVAYLDYQKSPETGLSVLTATLGESELHEAKNRYNLPSKIYDFSFAKLFDTIPNNKTTAAAPAAVPTPAAVAA